MATKRFITPFAESGIKAPVSDVPAGTDVNYETGYTPEYALDPVSDPNARFVEITNENQILNDITGNIKLWQDDNYPEFIRSVNNGGVAHSYNKNVVVRYNGELYISTEDGNDTLPTSAKWIPYLPSEIAKYLELKIFQSPTDSGLTEIQTRTLLGGEVYEVRKTSDNSLATIYSDAAGTTEIVQDGTDNKSGSDGVVEFYIADGDYYVEVNSVQSRFLTLYNKNSVTPAMYGVVKGYDSGNASKIEAMISSGRKIQWGSESYGVDRCIGGGSQLGHNIEWESDGCEIFIESSSTLDHQQAVLWYLITDGHQNISGSGLTFNANSKANVGYFFENRSVPNYPDGYGSFYAENLCGKNILRTLDFNHGSGGSIEGAFTSVILDSPVSENCIMSVGAGIPTSQGISGINVAADNVSGGYSLYTEINNPKIDTVKSLDYTYNMDQDGVKVFGGRNSGDIISTCTINGGRFSNCFGRSIKGQVTNLKASGPTFYRDDGWSNSVGLVEIVNQFGKADVDNVNCEYLGLFTPAGIVGTSSSPFGESTQGTVDGVSVIMRDTNAQLGTVVSTYSNNKLGKVEVKNITVDGGSINSFVEFHVGDDNDSLSLVNAVADKVNNEAVATYLSGRQPLDASVVHIYCDGVENYGSVVPLSRARVSGRSVNVMLNCGYRIVGLSGSKKLSITEDNQPILTRVNGIAGDYRYGTYLKMLSERLEGGESYEFESHGYISGARKAVINCNFGSQSIAEVYCDNSSLVEVFSGSDIIVGNTSEPPGSALFKAWINTETGGLIVKNRAIGARVVSVLYF